MKTSALLVVSLFGAFAASAATPIVSNVQAEQGPRSRTVKITYTLAESPAVITVDVQTNRGDGTWISIGAENQTCMTGDLSVVVPAGNRTIIWKADKAWPDQCITGGNIRFGVTAWATNAPPDYMVVDLSGTDPIHRVRYYPSLAALPDGGLTNDIYRTERLVMRKIPAGGVEWNMGSPSDEIGRVNWNDQYYGTHWEDRHPVMLTEDYYIGIYELTQKQWTSVGRSNPSDGNYVGDAKPVNNVSYNDIRGSEAGAGWPGSNAVDPASFIGQLRDRVGLEFDLPTEAQWEFACRAGSVNALFNGWNLTGTLGEHVWGSDIIGAIAWYVYSAEGVLHAVGTRGNPNNYGLYDLYGNVAEFCLDWLQVYAMSEAVQVDPVGPTAANALTKDGGGRVQRGGSIGSIADVCRSAARGFVAPGNAYNTYGFRLACPAVAK